MSASEEFDWLELLETGDDGEGLPYVWFYGVLVFLEEFTVDSYSDEIAETFAL